VKLISWNLNSIRQRLPRLLALLTRHEPDVVCLQETKQLDESFPAIQLEAAGYRSASYGQRAYNGVAILARDPITDVVQGFPGDPLPDEARVISGTVRGVRVVNVYAVNGKAVGHPAYELKLRWFDALAPWVGEQAGRGSLLVAGDFNVAPRDLDVHDPARWHGRILASEPERQRVRRLTEQGFVDLGQRAVGDGPGLFTWWDYRMGAFHRGWGLRLDLVLASAALADRLVSVEVDREERKPTSGEGKPSDHAPVIVNLRD
jgi:exodeoxyribonuclease-3